ncbi:MAG: HlyD family type I secretion periplasmic adaptor subunit, partial [Deltaproteobacteria bacterium]|nr:HlyD family type I secretion periplasmic adaptor subunit [Deltaproteobacteria bacterium]
MRWLSVAVCVFFFAAVLWAAFAKLDEVTHAEGQVIASSRTQVIQNLEGGILSSVEVQEGQTVEKNELLARLDNENAESVQRDMLYKAMENMTAIHRLRAIVDGKDSLAWPENFQAWLEKGAGYSITPEQLRQGRELAAVQSETFAVQKRHRHAELHVLEAQYSQRREDVREKSSRRRQLQNALSLIRQQIAMAGPLVARQSYSRANFLEMQERAAKTES